MAMMTRPHMVRADTIDLQDTDAPSAAEHTKHPSPNGIAPHQAAQYQNVQHERQSEEQGLADAWQGAGDDLGLEEGADRKDLENEEHGEGAEGEDGGEEDADDDMMDRISSSPSIDDEDIDFEFVYALHTFVATVEGQANATKGDTMVLLDDTNSYWWLVRVVKDSSIGYLPAEHIETPTERLARLNKHRNIDLSQTMLGDNTEKTKNPLKKAMRRRNAKTVQFAAPTYVEASDYDYSTDEEQSVVEPYASAPQQEEVAAATTGQPVEVEERRAPEEANVHATRRFSGDQTSTVTRPSLDAASRRVSVESLKAIEDPQLSPKLVDRTEAAPLKSRKGTPRNTDSFLKDDSIETRKITLTPGLLREDASSKNSSIDSLRNNSMEVLDKSTSPIDEKPKKDSKDKKKDKKPGMLSGLFKSKKKDKKGSKDDAEQSDAEKASMETGRNSPRPGTISSIDSSSTIRTSTGQSNAEGKQPQTRAKLQKAPPRSLSSDSHEPTNTPQNTSFLAELEGSEAAIEMPAGDADVIDTSRQIDTEAIAAQDKDRSGPLLPIANLLKSNDKAPKARRSKDRVELDDFDTPMSEGPNPFLELEQRERESSQDDESLSESPVEISSPGTFMHGTETIHIPTPGMREQLQNNERDEDDDEHHPTPEDSLSASPSLIEHPIDEDEEDESTPTATAPQSPEIMRQPLRFTPTQQQTRETANSSASSSPVDESAVTPTSPNAQHDTKWDDASLRTWLDAEEVKDMMYIIHSSGKAQSEPMDSHHPLVQGLYSGPKKGVQDMMGRLDGLLGSYLQRKGVTFT